MEADCNVGKRSDERIRTGTASEVHIQVNQDEQPWPCSWVVDHILGSTDSRNKVSICLSNIMQSSFHI